METSVNGGGPERRRSALLSADVVGYSRLMAEDDVETVRTLLAYRGTISVLIERHHGRVVDAPGDNVLAEFPEAADALMCARDVQDALQSRNRERPESRRMRFRIGLHAGEVLVDEGKLYGDTVNITARLEGLAEPGGIRLSSSMARSVDERLRVELDDLGDHALKNIPRPVQVYSVQRRRTDAPQSELPAMAPTVPGFQGRPAIAVLPFEAAQVEDGDVLAAGLTDDLADRISSWRSLPVIASESARRFAEDRSDPRKVGRELGVRYLVTGSVRRSGERVRVHARLLDTESAQQVWNQRYDRNIDDLFDAQDEISYAVVAAIEPEMRRVEPQRSLRRDPRSLSGWECLQRGQWHLARFDKENNQKACELLKRATVLDPESASAFGFYGLALAFSAIYAWAKSPKQALDEALRMGEHGVALDDRDPFAHRALGGICAFHGQLPRAVEENRTAIQLHPSYAIGYWGLGQLLPILGDSMEGVAMLQNAIRLSPHDPLMDQFLADLALAYFGSGLYEDALSSARQSLSHRRRGNRAWPFLVAALGQLDRSREAAQATAEALTDPPEFTASGIVKVMTVMRADPALIDKLIEGFERAGLSTD